MATFDSANIEFTFIDNPNSWVFSYNGMPLSSSFPEASQIQLRYEAVQVYSGGTEAGGGVLVNLSDLTPALQEQIRVLSTDLYVVDATAHNVTVQDLSNQQANVTGLVETYFYAPSAAPSGLTPLRIRRSTDINTAVITYQPGARLTSDVLNATTAQLLNATQELTAFGQSGATSGGGSSGTPDLSGNLLSDIGNVDIPTGNGPLIWNDSQAPDRWSVGSSGNFVPPGDTLDSNYVLRKASTVSGAYEWWDIVSSTDGFAGLVTSISANSTDIMANNSAITTLQDKTQNITATSAATTIANDLNVGDDIVATDNIIAGGDVVGQSIQAVNGTTHASVYAGTRLTDGGLGRAQLWHSAGRLNLYGESNSGFYFGSTASNSTMQIGSVALYSSSNNATAGSSSVHIRGRSSLNTTTNGGASQIWTSAGGHYTYNADQNDRAMGKCVHQSSPVGYTYVNSAYEPTGTASSDRTYDLQNIDGAYRNASPSHGGGAYTGGSSYYHRVRILGKDIARYTNKGAMYLNNPVNDAEFRINLSNVQSGQAGQDEIAIGMYQDDYWNGPGNARGKWTFSVRGDGYVFAKGFHNNSDPTNKDFEAPVMANNAATTKLKALTILPFRYKNDDGTANPTGPIHYGFNADEFVDLDLDDFGIVSTSGVAAESDSVDAGADIIDEAPTTEDGLPVLSSNPATALAKEDPGTQLSLDPLAVTALTVQVVQQVEARVTTLEAAPSGGIDSDTTTGGANTVAIANMVTIPTTDYGALTPDSGTIYFLTP